jgi:hypothetical protein
VIRILKRRERRAPVSVWAAGICRAVLAHGHHFSFSARPDQLIRSAIEIKRF